jgi:predicted DNA-binding transcriptional regulator YafY
MTKTQRLLALLQLLRCYRYPVTAAVLAEKLGISARTVYRDIASLQQGVDIEGSAGLGYQLRSDHFLPPLLFNQHELDALLLDLNWVRSLADANLNDAVQNALVKI